MVSDRAFGNNYELMELLGEGGFGIVHKARQRATGQLVAIKRVHLPSHAKPAVAEIMLERFLREAHICARLYHPNVVQVIDAGKTDDGQLYTVFSYVPGRNLADVLADEGAIEPLEAQYLMLQVLDALACAHAQGVIHRDLKPSNVMLIPTGARRNALVLDFGISTVTRNMHADEYARLTGTKELLGTPGYAAPEQLRGRDASPATDLFSWGLMFVECVTGRPVYSGSSIPDLIFRQLEQAPVPIPEPLRRSPLGELLGEVLQKDPAARPQGAAPLLRRLDDCDLRGLSRAALCGTDAVAGAVARRSPWHVRFASTIMLRRLEDDLGTAMIKGERRQVTALCCDLLLRRAPNEREPTGTARATTSRSSRSSVSEAEGYHTELRTLLGRVAELVEEHRGALVTLFGQRAMFYFGFPQAEEHDSRRALDAARAIAAVMREERERLVAQGMTLTVGVGVHSGFLVIPDRDTATDADLTIGETPEIAAALAARAHKRTILVSATAQRLLRTKFAFEAAGTLDDADEPLLLFHLLPSPGAANPPTTGRGDGSAHGALIGRERELAQLVERWRRAGHGAGQCCLLSGEPGIGKSRLAHELRHDIKDQPHTYLECRCLPDAQNSTWLPIVELLQGLIKREAVTGEHNVSELDQLDHLLGRYGLEPATQLPLLATLLGIDYQTRYAALELSTERQIELTREALIALLLAMADERPVLLMVEDLHWCDPSTLSLLSALAHQLGQAPLLALFTARPAFSITALAPSASEISLTRLSSHETEAVVAELVDGCELPEDILRQIVRKTDGVPLFVEEFTQMLIDSGTLVEDGDAFVIGQPLAPTEIPNSLRELLSARLDRLEHAKETAQLAAVIGREFSLQLLTAANGVAAEALQVELDELQRAGLIQHKRGRGDSRYLFKHALIRDAAYESLIERERVRLHAHVARTLESEFPSVVESRPDLLAYHFAAAKQPREAIGYAQTAARQQLVRMAYAEASAQVNQALTWLEDLDDAGERLVAELALKSILMPAIMASVGYGDPQIEPLAARIRELCELLGTPAEAAPILYALTVYYYMQAQCEQALELSQRMVRWADESGTDTHATAYYGMLATSLTMSGRFEEACAAAERSLELYDPSRHRDIVTVYGLDPRTYSGIWLGVALHALGYLTSSTDAIDRALAWAREMKRPDMLALGLFFRAGCDYRSDEFEQAAEIATEGILVCDRYGLPSARAWARMTLAAATRDVATIHCVIAEQRVRGELAGLGWLMSVLAEAEVAHGHYNAAGDQIAEALRFCEQHQEKIYLSPLLRLQGEIQLLCDPDRPERAEASLLRAIEVAEAQGAKLQHLRSATALARLWQQRGQAREAHAMLAPVYDWFTEGLDKPPLQRARALLCELSQQL